MYSRGAAYLTHSAEQVRTSFHMCVYICVCVCICIYARVYIYIYMYVYTHMNMYTRCAAYLIHGADQVRTSFQQHLYGLQVARCRSSVETCLTDLRRNMFFFKHRLTCVCLCVCVMHICEQGTFVCTCIWKVNTHIHTTLTRSVWWH